MNIMNKLGITWQRGGLSGVHFQETLPSKQGGKVTKSATLDGRIITDLTNIHPEKEVFLLGNLYALKNLAQHLCRGLIGFVAGACSLGIGWLASKTVRKLTADLFQIPLDIFEAIPALGNIIAARYNTAAFEEAVAAKEAPIFLKNNEEPFIGLRKLVFKYNYPKAILPDELQNTLSELVSKINLENLLLLLSKEYSALKKITPNILWDVCKQKFTEKVVEGLEKFDNSGTHKDKVDLLSKFFAISSVEELLNRYDFLCIKNQYPYTYRSFQIGYEMHYNVPANIWREALAHNLQQRFPEKNSYLAALPRKYIEEIYRTGGVDPISYFIYTKDEIVNTLKATEGGMGSLTAADWEGTT